MTDPRRAGTVYSEGLTGIEPSLGRMKQGRTPSDAKRLTGPSPNQPPPHQPQISPKQEAQKNQQVNTEESHQKIDQLLQKHTEVLFSAKTVFPFDLFPDKLTIRSNKIEVIQSDFFFSSHTESVPLQDIAHVMLEQNPFFAKLSITNLRKRDTPITLHYLKPWDAIKAKRLIEGLLVAQEAGTDVTTIDSRQYVDKIEQLGATVE